MYRLSTLLLCLWSTFVSAQSVDWKQTILVRDSLQSGRYPSLVADQQGGLHLTYWHEQDDALVYASKKPGAADWRTEVVTTGGGFRSQLRIDSAGNPHVAFFANVSGEAYPQYGYRTGNGWRLEFVSTESAGTYNPPFTLGQRYIQPSLDLLPDSKGAHTMIYFDARWSGACVPEPSVYKFELVLAERNPETGDWSTRSFGDIPAFNPADANVRACEGIAGARYGEFARLATDATGRLHALTPALINGELYDFVREDAGTYTRIKLDSNLAFAGTRQVICRVYGSYEGLSVTRTPDSVLHLTYAHSYWYGDNSLLRPESGKYYMLGLMYATLRPDGSFSTRNINPGFAARDDHYRAFTSLAHRGVDTLVFSYTDREAAAIMLALSVDGGANWRFDVLAHSPSPRYFAPITATPDSLHVVYYNETACSLVYGQAAWNDLQWRFTPLLTSSEVGQEVRSFFDAEGLAAYCYQEPRRRRLMAATRLGSTFLQTQPIRSEFAPLAFDAAAYSDAWRIAYTESDARKLFLDIGNDTILLDTARIASVSISLVGDTLHLIGADLAHRRLTYQSADARTGAVTKYQLVDTTGERGRIWPGPGARLYATYYDRKNDALMLAERRSNVWRLSQLDTLLKNAPAVSASYDTSGRFWLAYRHPFANCILLRNTDGVVDTVYARQDGIVGSWLSLQFDSTGHPWVMFDHLAGIHDLRLLRRVANNANWQPVPFAANLTLPTESAELWLSGAKAEVFGRFPGGLVRLKTSDWSQAPIARESTNPTASSPYPNPFDDYLLVPPCSGNITLTDMLGRLIYSGTSRPDTQPLRINTSDLAPGVYILYIGDIRYKVIRR